MLMTSTQSARNILLILSLQHALSLHSFKLPALNSLLDLALHLFLLVFKVTLVTELNHVPGLADFALEATKGAFDRFAIAHSHLDFDRQRSVDF